MADSMQCAVALILGVGFRVYVGLMVLDLGFRV